MGPSCLINYMVDLINSSNCVQVGQMHEELIRYMYLKQDLGSIPQLKNTLEVDTVEGCLILKFSYGRSPSITLTPSLSALDQNIHLYQLMESTSPRRFSTKQYDFAFISNVCIGDFLSVRLPEAGQITRMIKQDEDTFSISHSLLVFFNTPA